MSADDPTQRKDDFPEGTPWWARLLVSNIRDCYKWFSTYFTLALAALPLIYEYAPDLADHLSPTEKHWLMTGLALLTFLSRIVNQAPKP